MKKITTQLLLISLAAFSGRADTALTIGANYSCFDLHVPYGSPPTISASFTLNGVSGAGGFRSDVSGYYKYFPDTFYVYDYKLDLSALPAAGNHCVKLLIHFGTPVNCANPDLLSLNPAVDGSPSQIQSATLGPFGDVKFVFAGGCLQPAQPTVGFTLVSAVAWKTNVVTIIDDYVDQASGQTNEARVNVPALVPDIAPDPPPWEIAYYYSRVNPPFPIFQGAYFGCNAVPLLPHQWDFRIQLLNEPSNGVAMSQVVTQSLAVSANGLINLPLPFDPVSFGGSGLSPCLSLAVRPTGSNVNFTPLNPPLPLTPTPQALYALSAGTVADLAPGQAVTSLNGLTDALNLQAGNGIVLGTNGNTLVLSTQPGVSSDKNLKTDFANLRPEEILAKLAALRIQAWRYTNEVAGVRHVGPMAQDFKAVFGLGHDDKLIEFVDEEGVALAAIQGLNQKMETENAALRAENARLNARLEKLEQRAGSLSAEPK